MSEENVEVVLEGVDALNRRDPDAFIACVHPDVVWEVSGEVSPFFQGIYRGRAEAREWFEKAFLEGSVWETFHAEVEEIEASDDGRVFLGVFVTARGRGSGVETEAHAWQVCWFADGKIARRQIYLTRDEALEAAGLRE
jgi:ketosteroid isomerase-like protein